MPKFRLRLPTVLFVLPAVVVFLFSGCALTRSVECQRSRDNAVRIGANVKEFGVEFDQETKRRVSSEYDGILESYDMICQNQNHMTGDEYTCEVRRHASMSRLMGEYLQEAKACGDSEDCRRDAMAHWRAKRADLSGGCNFVKRQVEDRAPVQTQTGASLPTEGTPHGSGLITGAGLFGGLGPIIALDTTLAYAITSRHEIGIAFDFGDNDGGTLYGLRARYTYYFRADKDFKPFVRGSLGYFRTEGMEDEWYDPITLETFGPLVEGGIVYDFTRWVGLYAEAAFGYAIAVNDDTGSTPILMGGLGVHFRFVD